MKECVAVLLKESKHTFSYEREERISEYELLIKYNPQFINRKCQALEEQINAMYHLNISHMTCDEATGVVVTSYPLEKLVVWIIEKKEELEHYKKQSSERLNLLKRIISTYKYQDQQEIMHYMRTNGIYKPHKSIEKLCKDLYKQMHEARLIRQKHYLKEQEERLNEEVEEVRAALQTQREELVI